MFIVHCSFLLRYSIIILIKQLNLLCVHVFLRILGSSSPLNAKKKQVNKWISNIYAQLASLLFKWQMTINLGALTKRNISDTDIFIVRPLYCLLFNQNRSLLWTNFLYRIEEITTKTNNFVVCSLVTNIFISIHWLS